jgi:cholesterol transport system auxiliary component
MRRSTKAAVSAALCALGLAGCVSLLPAAKPAQLYRFGDDRPPPARVEAPPGTGSTAPKVGVVLEQINFPRTATSDGILTVTGDKVAYVEGARWAAPARTLFQEALERELEYGAARAELVGVGDPGAAGAVLRIEVSAFEVDYGRSRPTVVIALNARLTASSGQVLDQRDFSVSQPAAVNSVSAIVAAFDQGTDAIIGSVGQWVDGEVAAMPPPPPPARVISDSSSTTTTTTTQTRPGP